MNEELNSSLKGTIEELIKEQDDRLQTHLRERMQALDDRSRLNQELDKTKSILEETSAEKVKF